MGGKKKREEYRGNTVSVDERESGNVKKKILEKWKEWRKVQ